MSEIIISLDWEYLDDLLEYIDNKLTWCNFPTILRMRAQMVAEELFQALMRTEDAAQTRMRCTNPDQKTILLQYRSPPGTCQAGCAHDRYAGEGRRAVRNKGAVRRSKLHPYRW